MRRAHIALVLAIASAFVASMTACSSSGTGSGRGATTHAASGASADASASAATASASSVPSAAQKLPAGVLSSVALDSGSSPAAMTAAFGSVWVGSHRSHTLYRIDPHRDAIVARIDLNQDTCAPVLSGAGRIWTDYCDDGSAQVVVDARTDEVVGALHAMIIYGFAGDAGWATSEDGTHSVRFDAVTLRITGRLPVVGINGIVAGGYLWVAGGDNDTGHYDGTIWKLDLHTNRVLAEFRTPATGSFPFFAATAHFLWFKGTTDPYLIRLDISTGEASKVVVPGVQPLDQFGDADPVAANGSLWLRTAQGTVSRLDENSGRILKTYPADATSGGGSVAVAGGSLWLANFGSDTVWRDRI